MMISNIVDNINMRFVDVDFWHANHVQVSLHFLDRRGWHFVDAGAQLTFQVDEKSSKGRKGRRGPKTNKVRKISTSSVQHTFRYF